MRLCKNYNEMFLGGLWECARFIVGYLSEGTKAVKGVIRVGKQRRKRIKGYGGV